MSRRTTLRARVAYLDGRVAQLEAVVVAYEVMLRAAGRPTVCRECAAAGSTGGVLCGGCHGAGMVAP